MDCTVIAPSENPEMKFPIVYKTPVWYLKLSYQFSKQWTAETQSSWFRLNSGLGVGNLYKLFKMFKNGLKALIVSRKWDWLIKKYFSRYSIDIVVVLFISFACRCWRRGSRRLSPSMRKSNSTVVHSVPWFSIPSDCIHYKSCWNEV